MQRHKVFLVDDHPLVRESLSNLINQQHDLAVCGEAGESPRAISGILQTEPDVAIVDISLTSGSGLELIKWIKTRAPKCATIVLSMHDEKLYAERAIRAGARGYVMKRESTKRIISAIRQVLQGRIFLSDQMSADLAERFAGGKTAINQSPISELSDRELEVFNLLGRGLETRQIAENLHVSIKTVQAYCARMKLKLKVSNATELLREAIRWNEQQASDGMP
jgi:DNA-binding NarL/FixJ family response regulator